MVSLCLWFIRERVVNRLVDDQFIKMREAAMKKQLIIYCLFIIFAGFTACDILNSNDDSNPDFPGIIVFSAFSEGEWWQIFTINANGTDLRQLTFADSEPINSANDKDFYGYRPTWSPNGKTILANGRSVFPVEEIISMNENGENLKTVNRLMDGNEHPVIGNHPQYSPDGSEILYNDPHGGAFIYTVETREIFHLHNQFNENNEQPWFPLMERPRWSPKGDHILFAGAFIDDEQDVYIVTKDGTDLTRLQIGFHHWASWHPNNRDVTVRLKEDTPGIYLVNTDTKERDLLFSEEESNYILYPQAWSPDGSYLLTMGRQSESHETYYLIILDINNGSLTEVHSSPNSYRNADWFIE